MAIEYPFDLLSGFRGWSTEFQLLWRQEQSRTSNGRTLVKDFGSPLWTTTYQSRSLSANELDYWRARLDLMENGLQTFYGRSLSRCYPIDDPRGDKISGGEGADLVFLLDFVNDYAVLNDPDEDGFSIGAISPDRKTVVLDGPFPTGYRLGTGDMIQFGPRNLHRIMQAEAIVPGEATTRIEVRPHLWPETQTGDATSFIKPHCIMSVVPGSISSAADASTGRGVITFQAIEAR